MEISPDLIDLIYDAALDRSVWPRLLERLSDEMRAGPAVLLVQNQITMHAVGLTARLDPGAFHAFNAYFAFRNPMTANNSLDTLRSGRFPINTDESIVERAELLRSEYFHDFMTPNDMGSVLMAAIGYHGQSAATVNLHRTAKTPHFEADDIRLLAAMRPHLTRSFRLGLMLDEARQTGDALLDHLDRSPHGLFLIDGDGSLRHVNRAAETMLDDGLSVFNGKLTAMHAEDTRRLRIAISNAVSPKGGRAGGSLSLPRISMRRPYAVIVAPLKRDGLVPMPWGPAALVCVTDPEAGVALPEQRLSDLFGLTRAEASVAVTLLAGHDTKAIAWALDISPHTVRVHLARIMEKTHTNRQAELVRLMMQVTGWR